MHAMAVRFVLRDSERRSPAAVVATAEQRARYCTVRRGAGLALRWRFKATAMPSFTTIVTGGCVAPMLAVGRVVGVVEAMVASAVVRRAIVEAAVSPGV